VPFASSPHGAGAGPASDSLAVRIAADLSRRRENLVTALDRTRSMSDAEAIHDLRVASRRISAALRLWREMVPPRDGRRALRRLRDLRRDAGGTRDLEVHVTILTHLLRARPDSGSTVVIAWLERLERRLARERRRAARALRRGRVRRLLRSLERVESAIPGTSVEASRVLWSARERISALRAGAAETIRLGLGDHQDETLHRTRIALKKLRYALESMGRIDPHEEPLEIERLRAMQDALGDAHDRAVLVARIARRRRRAVTNGDAVTAGAFTPLAVALETERRESLGRFHLLASPAE
jgi:CHAD domain-containing protein